EMEEHRDYLHSSGAIRHLMEEKNSALFVEILKERLFAEAFEHIRVNGRFREIIEGLMTRHTDPYTAAEEVLAERFGIRRVDPHC
ncbi:MAG TPA: methylmalonyl Co-A mutase-associated GTPase MeaB, partial [Geobacteraceae bacterium]|nr:methylmalonyl Co-A mutase-associated GTPase MeaB [Geobacteraceae bacterium]